MNVICNLAIASRVACIAVAVSLLLQSPSLADLPPSIDHRMMPVKIDGESIRLAVRINRPAGKGPFPTLIFHHGSTGWGTDPERFKVFREFEKVADWFVRRGWMVVLPARRGRGGSEGLYDEGFNPDRKQGYSCDVSISLAGFSRALDDIDAITEAITAMPSVDSSRLLVGGVSRGGILSIAHSGRQPDRYQGAINFVGGWMGTGCRTAKKINQTAFAQGASFGKETLWLYAKGDRYYKLSHSRGNFKAYKRAGGKGTFFSRFRDGIGHFLASRSGDWSRPVNNYLERLELPREVVSASPIPPFEPDQDRPARDFLGVWKSSWYGTPSSLTVTSISDDGLVSGTYRYGEDYKRDFTVPLKRNYLVLSADQTTWKFFVATDNIIRSIYRSTGRFARGKYLREK